MNSKTLQFAQKIPGWLSIKEGRFLEEKAKGTEMLKGVAVEIGSFCGRSTVFIAQTKGKIYSIDPHMGNVEPHLKFPNTYKKFIKNIKKAEVQDKIVPIVATSKDAAKRWNKKIRFLFIDALHDETNARLDFDLWSKHLVDGGTVAMHDSFLHWCGSETVALEKIVSSPKFYKIGIKDSIVYGVKGHGNILDKLKKLFWQMFIVAAVWINRSITVVRNLPSPVKYASLLIALAIPISLVL